MKNPKIYYSRGSFSIAHLIIIYNQLSPLFCREKYLNSSMMFI